MEHQRSLRFSKTEAKKEESSPDIKMVMDTKICETYIFGLKYKNSEYKF